METAASQQLPFSFHLFQRPNSFLVFFQIIGLLDVFTPSKSLNDFSDVYLVTHLMGADLNNIVKTQRLSDDHVQFLIYQILRGMKYVHSAGIIHRVRK